MSSRSLPSAITDGTSSRSIGFVGTGQRQGVYYLPSSSPSSLNCTSLPCSAPCPRIWVICSHTMLLQSDLAGERSQFAAENKTASERTFVRFLPTKHGSFRITVGRWLPKETTFDPPPGWGASTSSRSQGEVHHDGGYFFFSLPWAPS